MQQNNKDGVGDLEPCEEETQPHFFFTPRKRNVCCGPRFLEALLDSMMGDLRSFRIGRFLCFSPIGVWGGVGIFVKWGCGLDRDYSFGGIMRSWAPVSLMT